MQKIQILPDVLASQVAAGEVVERPASVIKELVENSLDAGAKHILVEIRKGGTAYIKVSDNGCGMSEQDALMSLERHATSKLRTVAELSTVLTMGFRGEAVPSVASVSHFKLVSCEPDALEATEILVEGGKLIHVKKTGAAVGTSIEVKQLFYNIPARRKFLKTESTESAHVENQVRLHALAYPKTRFTYKKDGRVVFDLPSSNERKVRIVSLMGRVIVKDLIKINSYSKFNMEVSGYVLAAQHARKGKKQQYIFLNGRPIEDAHLSRAIRDGFGGAIVEGANPVVWLWIKMDAKLVDVNVHPAKKEVRFQKAHEVRMLMTEAVAQMLGDADSLRGRAKIVSKLYDSSSAVDVVQSLNRKPLEHNNTAKVEPQEMVNKSHQGLDKRNPQEKVTELASEEKEAAEKHQDTPKITQKSNPFLATKSPFNKSPQEQQQEFSEERKLRDQPDFKPLALLHGKFILLQGEEGLVVLQPKAARERIVYETLIKAEGAVASQSLLLPEVLELDAFDTDLVKRNLDNFYSAGFQLEVFGANSFQLSAIPQMLNDCDAKGFVLYLIDELCDTLETKSAKSLGYDVLAKKIAKKMAMRENANLEQTNELLSQLFQCELPYCNPEGTPTLVQISISELNRKFGRK